MMRRRSRAGRRGRGDEGEGEGEGKIKGCTARLIERRIIARDGTERRIEIAIDIIIGTN